MVRHKGAGARKSEWAACDRCNKWRRLPRSVVASSLPDPWYCEMNTWDEQRNRCEVAEERLRYGDGNEQDDLSVIPTVAQDGTQLVMSADSATGYKGVALSAGGKRSRDEAAALSDTAPYRVEYSMDKDGKLAPKGAGVRKTRYFASCLEAATWHAARPHAPRGQTRTNSGLRAEAGGGVVDGDQCTSCLCVRACAARVCRQERESRCSAPFRAKRGALPASCSCLRVRRRLPCAPARRTPPQIQIYTV